MPSATPSPISPRRLRAELHSIKDDGSPPTVIAVVAWLLQRSVARADRDGTSSVLAATAFRSHQVPDISVQAFMERICRCTRAGPAVCVLAYIYLDRLHSCGRGVAVSACNVHRLLLTAFMVASKFLEDLNFRNSHFAKAGGVSTEEMNRMELEFLFMMDFRLHVNVRVFESYCGHLEREVGTGGAYHIERALMRSICAIEEVVKTSKEVEENGRSGRSEDSRSCSMSQPGRALQLPKEQLY